MVSNCPDAWLICASTRLHRAARLAGALRRAGVRPEERVLIVLPDGFEWQDQKYGSLSAIAKAITGTNWNGYAFFGLKNGSKARASSTERTHAA